MKKTLIGLIPFAAILAPAIASAEVNQPQEIIDRPRTTPGGQITVGADLFIHLAPGDLGLALGDPTGFIPAAGDGLAAKYGVNDKLEVGVSYGFALKEFEAKGDLGVHAAYSILGDGNLTVAATARLGYNLLLEGIDPLRVGAEVQFKLSDKLAVYSGGNQIQIGIAEKEIVQGPVTVTITDPSFIALPVGVGFQVNEKIFAHVDTNVAVIEIKDSETGFIFADFLPLDVGAYFSPSNTMDLHAGVGFGDLVADGDKEIHATVGARLHM